MSRRPPALGAGTLAFCLLGVLACSAGTSEPFIRQTFGFTFENNLSEWVGDGTDLDDPPVVWSVERSQEVAEQSIWSVKLSLENLNDAGKIWIEQSFPLLRGGTYDVEIAFDFASADFGDVNLWTIITGASQDDPETVDDLTFREDTGNGSDSDVGFRFQPKRYTTTVTADPETGLAWIALGVWGTSEFSRAYFIDDIEIAFTLQ